VVVVVAGVAITGVLQIFQLRITENLQQKIFARAAFEFAFRIPRIRMEALYQHYAPELMNRFFDTMSVQKGLSKILIDFSSASLQIVFGLILLSFYHPFFILFSLLLIVIVYVFIRLSLPRGLKTSLKESKHKYDVAHWLEEVARTSTTFKLAGDSPLPMTRTDEHVQEYLNARESHFNVLVRHYSVLVVFKVIVATGLLAIGGMLVMQQHMNIGQFVAAEIIILLVMSSVEKLIMSTETIYDVLTSLEKIGQVTDLELDNETGRKLSQEDLPAGLEIDLMGIFFKYPEHKKYTLKDINLSIQAGERILITGANGSGKSTLLQVIAGLYIPQEGTISYQGVNRSTLNVNDLQSVIGDCLSQELLFQGSLLENITMGRPEATLENVQWALQNLGLNTFIKSLADGYNTLIDPQGRKLPKSIVQKLIIARSIVDFPKLLLLEDAFEHLDKNERTSILDFLFAKERSWTAIAVSSVDDLSPWVNRTVIMDSGSIVDIHIN
jgi:ABC-type bacteriocin/lantibiotic exporter with double-glycine peptidase domain